MPSSAGPRAPAPSFHVVHPIRPRFRDTDAMGHVNNAVYVTYLEVARQVYWERAYAQSDYGRVPFILAHVSIDFRSEALVHELLEIGIRCEWIGDKSFAFSYRVWEKRTERVVVEATTVQVCYDYAAKRTLPVTAELRARLEEIEGRSLARPPGR